MEQPRGELLSSLGLSVPLRHAERRLLPRERGRVLRKGPRHERPSDKSAYEAAAREYAFRVTLINSKKPIWLAAGLGGATILLVRLLLLRNN